MKRTFLLILGFAMFAATAMAQNVSVNFDDGTVGGLVTTSSVSFPGFGGVPGNAAGRTDVIFAGAGNDGRSYLGTTFTDYTSDDFLATIDITVTDNGFDNAAGGSANGFFGLGPGIIGGGGAGGNPAFGEPTTGPAIYAAFNNDNRDGGEANLVDTIIGFEQITTTASNTPQVVVGTGTHTVTLDYSQATGTLEFIADVNQSGALVSLGTFNTSDNGFDSTNARIFFGGDDNTIFDNFVVTVGAIPEPTSGVLLGLGFVGVMCSRRRRG